MITVLQVKPGGKFRFPYPVSDPLDANEALRDFDVSGGPTYTAYKDDGTVDSTITPTTNHPGTGKYEAKGVSPASGYADADTISFWVTGTVNGLTDSRPIGLIQVTTKRVADLHDLASADVTAAVPTANAIATAVTAAEDAEFFTASTVSDTSPTTTTFKVATGLSIGWSHAFVQFTDGPNAKQWRPVSSYDPNTGLVTVSVAFPLAPANGNHVNFFGFSA